MADPRLLAIDVGTTAVKVALVTDGSEVMASATTPVTTYRDGARVEQDPSEWWSATCAAVRELGDRLVATDVAGVAITGQMQDLIPVRDGRHVGHAVLYSDHRAEAEHAQLVAALGEPRWFELTRNQQDAGNVAAKFRWLRAHEPARTDRLDSVLLGAHSYVAFRATGRVACDPTTATTTGLFDAGQSRWSDTVAAAADLDARLLPPIVDPGVPLGEVTPDAAAALGVPAGIPVFHSAGDAGAATVGVGAGTRGRYAYLGTSGWLAASVPTDAAPRRELYTLAHPRPGHAIQIGPMISVGACVDWALRTLVGAIDHAVLEQEVARVSAPTRLLFLPYLGGERSPFHDPSARGGYLGLDHDTDRATLLKATLEGVALSLATIADIVDDAHPGDEHPLRLSGGGSRSSVWCQLFADVFAQPVIRVGTMEHVGVIGAARLAAPGLGWSTHDDDGGAGDVFEPRPTYADDYRDLRRLHRALYPQLRATFHALTNPQRSSIS